VRLGVRMWTSEMQSYTIAEAPIFQRRDAATLFSEVSRQHSGPIFKGSTQFLLQTLKGRAINVRSTLH
jgi:hypothetical protein